MVPCNFTEIKTSIHSITHSNKCIINKYHQYRAGFNPLQSHLPPWVRCFPLYTLAPPSDPCELWRCNLDLCPGIVGCPCTGKLSDRPLKTTKGIHSYILLLCDTSVNWCVHFNYLEKKTQQYYCMISSTIFLIVRKNNKAWHGIVILIPLFAVFLPYEKYQIQCLL